GAGARVALLHDRVADRDAQAVVVDDGAGGGAAGQTAAGRAGQPQLERLVRLEERVADDRHADLTEDGPGRNRQRPGRDHVLGVGGGGDRRAVHGLEIDGDGLAAGARPRHGEDHVAQPRVALLQGGVADGDGGGAVVVDDRAGGGAAGDAGVDRVPEDDEEG